MSVCSYALMWHHLVTEMSIAMPLSVSKGDMHDLIGNAVPKNFTRDDMLKFVPEGEQIMAVTPEYKSRRKHRPVSIMIILSNDDMVRLRLF
jgi:hypothetical protein